MVDFGGVLRWLLVFCGFVGFYNTDSCCLRGFWVLWIRLVSRRLVGCGFWGLAICWVSPFLGWLVALDFGVWFDVVSVASAGLRMGL